MLVYVFLTWLMVISYHRTEIIFNLKHVVCSMFRNCQPGWQCLGCELYPHVLWHIRAISLHLELLKSSSRGWLQRSCKSNSTRNPLLEEIKSSKTAFLEKVLEPYVRKEIAERGKNGKSKLRNTSKILKIHKYQLWNSIYFGFLYYPFSLLQELFITWNHFLNKCVFY